MIYGDIVFKYRGEPLVFREDNNISNSLINKTDYVIGDLDTSIFVESLKMILDENRYFYININESYNNSKFNINEFITKIIDMCSSIVSKVWSKFESLMSNIMPKYEVVKQYEANILNIKNPVFYSEPYYQYTNIVENTSRTSIDFEIDKLYKDFDLSLNLIRKGKNPSSLNLTTNFDQIRGKLLSMESCSSSEFAENLFKYFRAGQSTPNEQAYITPDQIKIKINNFKDNSKTMKAIKKSKEDIEFSIKNTKAKIKSYSYDLKDINFDLNYFISSYLDRAKNTCDIFLQYFAARLDAVKEQYSTDLKILYNMAQYALKEGL